MMTRINQVTECRKKDAIVEFPEGCHSATLLIDPPRHKTAVDLADCLYDCYCCCNRALRILLSLVSLISLIAKQSDLRPLFPLHRQHNRQHSHILWTIDPVSVVKNVESVEGSR